MANKDIRIALIGYRSYKVAQILGITEFTFCRWLRKELPIDKKSLILDAIEKLATEKVI